MKNIWIYAEQTAGVLHPVYFELLGKAHELYPQENLAAVVLGTHDANLLISLEKSGVNEIIYAKHNKLASYHPDYYATTLAKLANTYKPDVIFLGATAIGSELAPSAAAKLQTGLAAHCVDFSVNDQDLLVAIIPAFGGKLLGEILIPEKRPAMATVKPGVFPRISCQTAENVATIWADTDYLDDYLSDITLVQMREMHEVSDSLETAEVVVCAGLGISSIENWEKAVALTNLLHGVLGYTRPAVDMGYVPNENGMVGTSGKMIRPKLYLSFGVSGATHHICGIKGAKTIISVNSDENAAIFNVSDYKLVGDCGAVLDELLYSLKA